MPDKQFLGLGFTFSATDKGLEQKLTNVNNVIKQISDNLDEVNKQFAKMTGTKTVNVKAKIQGAPASKARPMTSSAMPDHGWEKLLAYLQKNQGKSVRRKSASTGTIKDTTLSKGSSDWIAGIATQLESMGGNVKQFNHELKDLSIAVSSTGRLTSASKEKILDLGKATFGVDKTTEALNKQMKSLQVGLHAVGEYFKDIGNSANEFLKSLGLDFSKIIPDQFKSSAKLIGTVIAGPFRGFSKAFSFLGKKSKAEELQSAGNEFLQLASARIGGPGRKNKNLFTQLEELNKKNEKDKKGGMFDSLKDILGSPLLKLAAGLGALKAFTKLRFAGIANLFSKLGPLFSGLEVGFGSAIAAIFVFSAALSGLWKGLVKSFDSLSNGMILLWEGVKNLFEGLWDLTKAIGGPFISGIGDWISNMVAGSSALQLVVDGLTWVWKSIQKGWENIGELIGSILGLLGDKLGGLFFNWGEKLKDVAKGISNPAQPQLQPANVVKFSDYQKDLTTGLGAVADKSDDLRESLVKGNKETAKIQAEQNSLQREMNDKLERLVSLSDPSAKQMPSISLLNSFDARKFGLSVRQDENDKVAAGSGAF